MDDLAKLRKSYERAELSESDSHADPMQQFALWLLAPPCVLCGLRVQNAKEIVRYCDIPQTEAADISQ